MSLLPIEAGPEQFNGEFRTDFLSVSQLSLEDINVIHEEADAMRWMAEEYGVSDLLRGHIYDLVFWQSESTRTKGSFEHAITRLGGNYVLFDEATSSQAKGETFEDTIRMLDSYLIPRRDGFIIRHKDPGGVALAADIARSPVTNAGDGAGEHPTQAVLDTKTIRNRFPNLEDVRIAFFGDLIRARTVNSTAPLLAKLGVKNMVFVAPLEDLRASRELVRNLKAAGVNVTEADRLKDVAPEVDVIYGLRTQYNLMPKDAETQAEARRKYTGKCLMTAADVKGSKALFMHPLPEDKEDPNITPELRRDPRCIYEEQAAWGEWTRMAWLAKQAGKSILPEYRAAMEAQESARPLLHAVK